MGASDEARWERVTEVSSPLLFGRRVALVGESDVLNDALRSLFKERAPGCELLSLDPASPLEAADIGAVDAILYLVDTSDPFAPLDEVLRVSVHGVERCLATARVLGGVPVMLKSTLEVLGEREGSLFEGEPSEPPYPHARARGASFWSLDEETSLATSLVEEVRARFQHADQRSRLLEEARRELFARKEPTRGSALEDKVRELARARVQAALVEAGRERARGWGFVTTRGWARALAEQRVAASGLPFTVVRAGPLGAALQHPHPGALPDGAALAHLLERARRAPVRLALGGEQRVELIPVDLVAGALLVATASLLDGTAPKVVHASLSSKRPLPARRLTDLLDLYLRKRAPAESSRRARVALAPVDLAPKTAPRSLSVRALSRTLERMRDVVEARMPLPPVAKALADEVREAVQGLEGAGADEIDPTLFVWSSGQRLRAHHLPALERRLLGARGVSLFDVPTFEWRRWLLDVHLPAVERRLDEDAARASESAPLARYDNLLHLVEEAAERYGSSPAMSLFRGEERIDVSYRELLARARAVAHRLDEAGVAPGDRVLLSGENHPDWAIACFGVLFRGAVLVPIDPALSPEQAKNVAKRARVRLCIVDKKARKGFGDALEQDAGAPLLDLHLTSVSGPEQAAATSGALSSTDIEHDALASILFTSGTTGDPKGVMLSHANFASLIASLGGVFDMGGSDRLLSVLPLHHTFEFSCGLLLPLAAGGHIFYLDELQGERVLYALREGRITAMVGVPALWQLLERRLRGKLDELGGVAKGAFDLARTVNRALGEKLGVDAGALLFSKVHRELGGHLRTLISGGAALPKETYELFQSLGLPLAEGYGLTEAAPVLTVAEGGAGAPPGTVGRPIPGVELELRNVDGSGVGEVVARGANVMRGYFENEAATREVLDEDGWLKTGDLGRFDPDGRLVIVGRAKDVVVTASGENVYLDDVEARLFDLTGVKELTLVGAADARGGERLALVFVPDRRDADGEVQARASLDAALRRLPVVFRPSLVRAFDDDALPRTATRKVKRREVRGWLEERIAHDDNGDAESAAGADVPLTAVRGAVAMVAGLDVKKITAATKLSQDLGFDSLMWVELAGALEPLFGRPDAEALYACETVADLERFLASFDANKASARGGASGKGKKERVDARRIEVPTLIKRPARLALGFAQRELYRSLFTTEVEGRAHIPYNQPCIVVANHCSHLDTGLVKFAMGRYGEGLTPLAAKDYFFEGHPLKVAFFEHLTNLEPIERESGSGLAFEQAVSVVESGRVVLIFPEGTRRPDGTLGAFKPLVGRLSLKTGAPVLPMYLGGTYEALPKGARLPRRGSLTARIGPPLEAEALARLTAHLSPVEAARAATSLVHRAVVALSEGKALDLSEPASGAGDAKMARTKERVPS